jgi:transposase-like protein
VPRTRPPYPEEFRREAIRLAQLGDQPQRKLAKSLGISDVTLRHWLKEEKASRGERPGGLSTDEREELTRLRDENATPGTRTGLSAGRTHPADHPRIAVVTYECASTDAVVATYSLR